MLQSHSTAISQCNVCAPGVSQLSVSGWRVSDFMNPKLLLYIDRVDMDIFRRTVLRRPSVNVTL
jgi:hypothetical protein